MNDRIARVPWARYNWHAGRWPWRYKKPWDFIGQVNDVLCFFGKVSCDVKARLFRAYCTSFYGCELWDLSGGSLSAFCTAWRKASRRIWNLPCRTHTVTYCRFYVIACRYSTKYAEGHKFLQTCSFHNTSLIRSVAQFSLTEGWNSSPCGRNALFCIRQYQCALSEWYSFWHIKYFCGCGSWSVCFKRHLWRSAAWVRVSERADIY